MNKLISTLLNYSFQYLSTSEDDYLFLSNYLMNALEVKDFHYVENDVSSYTVPDELVKSLINRLLEIGYDEANANKKVCEIFGVLSPRPSEVRRNFFSLYEEEAKLATDYLFDLSIKNNYVQKTKIDQNIVIDKENEYGIIATINLSKPEKNNADIAKALKIQTDAVYYPSCAICIENEGCYGSSKTEPRNNLRLIPLTLSDNKWYLQYSPYGYYNEHCIVIHQDHIPMCVNKSNTRALFDFVDIFPHYFIGANSDLPIVGGSILTHEHFQGGRFEMPLMKAKVKQTIKHKIYDDLVFDIMEWPCFVLRITGNDKEKIIDVIDEFYQKYLGYENKDILLFSKTGDVRHNTMTTIVNKNQDGYHAYLLFRNNKTNEQYEGGIFHVRKENQHIKNEGIGLIEAMGLFIFPARLKRQLKAVEDIVKDPSIKDEMFNKYEDLKQFEGTIQLLMDKTYNSLDDYLLHVGKNILEDISIFKFDKDGSSLKQFLALLGF